MRATGYSRWNIAVALGLACISTTAAAFQISPSGTRLERHQAEIHATWYARLTTPATTLGIHFFTHPVHEEITQTIFGCDNTLYDCADPDGEFAPTGVIAGVRWNDDPPFRLSGTTIPACRQDQTIRVVTQPVCWAKLFKHAEKRSKTTYFDGNSNRWNILYRTHFGDLQFLHAMASRDGETADETRRRILMWSEFAWSVAIGAQDSKTPLVNIPVAGFSDFFPRSGQNVADLYTLGNPTLRRGVSDVAFGNLLHLVEDSFAFGHVDRAPAVAGATCPGTDHPHPGLIRAFRSYTNQDHALHGEYDTRDAFRTSLKDTPNVLDVGKVLLEMYDAKAGWDVVGPYLQCVFDVEKGAPAASPRTGLEG